MKERKRERKEREKLLSELLKTGFAQNLKTSLSRQKELEEQEPGHMCECYLKSCT